MLSDTKTELIDLANFMCKREEIEPIPLRFRNVTSYAGRAFLSKESRGYIGISNKRCVMCGNKAYREYVVIHEVCHFLYWDWYQTNEAMFGRADHHGPHFRKLEIYWLQQFGMIPMYSKVYCHTLTDGHGSILWSNKYDIYG